MKIKEVKICRVKKLPKYMRRFIDATGNSLYINATYDNGTIRLEPLTFGNFLRLAKRVFRRR